MLTDVVAMLLYAIRLLLPKFLGRRRVYDYYSFIHKHKVCPVKSNVQLGANL